MKNPDYNYQCIYDLDNDGYIVPKWVGNLKDPTWNEKRVPEDFKNYHPDDERYEDPRVNHLYELFGNEIKIEYEGYVYKKYGCGFHDNGTLIYRYEEIYRPVCPIFEDDTPRKSFNLPSEKKLRETGQWKDIKWTFLGPNPNYKK